MEPTIVGGWDGGLDPGALHAGGRLELRTSTEVPGRLPEVDQDEAMPCGPRRVSVSLSTLLAPLLRTTTD
jgi:hypothetical protein